MGSISEKVWFDGNIIPLEEATVPITTHAIHYGTSVFEGIRAYWNSENLNVFRLEEHVKRFRKSGEYYSMTLNFSDNEIQNAVIDLCKENNVRESCYIRPFYFVGQHGISLHITKDAPTHLAMFLFAFGDLFDKNGITAGISSWQKFSDASTPTQAKMGGNYLNSIIATQEAKKNGFDEAILLDHKGNVSEAPGENIFLVKDEELVTPPLSSSALDGITRDSVIEISKMLGRKTIIREIQKTELFSADEVFLTGTAAEITPIIKIDDSEIGNGSSGELTNKIIKEYSDIVMDKNQDFSKWLKKVY